MDFKQLHYITAIAESQNITRAAENEEHNACAIFTLRLPRSCTVNRLMTLVGKRKGIVSVEEL